MQPAMVNSSYSHETRPKNENILFRLTVNKLVRCRRQTKMNARRVQMNHMPMITIVFVRFDSCQYIYQIRFWRRIQFVIENIHCAYLRVECRTIYRRYVTSAIE